MVSWSLFLTCFCLNVFFSPSKSVLCVCGFVIFFSKDSENSLIGNKLFSYAKYKEERNEISRI